MLDVRPWVSRDPRSARQVLSTGFGMFQSDFKRQRELGGPPIFVYLFLLSLSFAASPRVMPSTWYPGKRRVVPETITVPELGDSIQWQTSLPRLAPPR